MSFLLPKSHISADSAFFIFTRSCSAASLETSLQYLLHQGCLMQPRRDLMTIVCHSQFVESVEWLCFTQSSVCLVIAACSAAPSIDIFSKAYSCTCTHPPAVHALQPATLTTPAHTRIATP